MEILTAMLMPANRRLLFPMMDWRALFIAYVRKNYRFHIIMYLKENVSIKRENLS